MQRVVAALLVLFAVSVLAGSAGARPEALRLVKIASFEQPVFAAAAPGQPGSLYVVQQGGRILVLQNGHVRATPFFDIESRIDSGGEQGLLSMAFDPKYAHNHLFYVDYTDLNGNTRVVRYRSNGTRAILSSAKTLLFVRDFAPNHNGGQLQFGPDGRLWWGNGDGGDEGDPQDNGQNLTRPFSKIERLNVRKPGAKWQVMAYGLRNPWRFSFDRANGDLYIADVGQNAWEEIDFLPRGFKPLINFGWRHFEGDHVYDGDTPLLAAGRYVAPVIEYSHSDGCSVTGGYVYRGRSIPSARGRYFYGDYCSGTIWSARVVGGRARDVRREPIEVRGLSSFAEDAHGELYAMSVDSGGFYRLSD